MGELFEEKISSVMNDIEIMKTIASRKRAFLELKGASLDEKFSELMFCILTANTSAEMGIRCQNGLDQLADYDFQAVRMKLEECRYRFKNTRARYISINSQIKDKLNEILELDDRREKLVETYLGIGMKESSHFLRNIGYFQYSIIDKHIQRFLSSYYSQEVPIKNAKGYMQAEILFERISNKYGMEPGIMDLIIWYIMTGKILK